MDTGKLTNETVKKALDALQSGNKPLWFSLFSNDVKMTDDGRNIDFQSFFEKALGQEHFTSIDKVGNNGLDVYGNFHSNQWGDFKTYFKFIIDGDGKISHLDIGQAKY